MKLGNLKVKRRYSLIQILVDLFSVGALLYIGSIIIDCALYIEEFKKYDRTGEKLDFLHWQPMLIWAALGVVLCVISVFALFMPRKKPKRYCVNERTAVKFCNTVDVCISCVRLIALMAVSELCFIHRDSILMINTGFPVQLVIDLAIIALLIWFTHIRLQVLSETAKADEEEKRAQRQIIED